MKYFRKITALICGLSFYGNPVAQVSADANFDTGNLASCERIDSSWIRRSHTDSVLVLTFGIHPRTDPANPVDKAIAPSSRWYHFRLNGVKDKWLWLNFSGTEVVRPFYSYDGTGYRRFDPSECIYPHTVTKSFPCDSVYVAYFVPYSHARYQEKTGEWQQSPFIKHETIGYSRNGLPIEMLTITDSRVPDGSKKRVWMHARVHTSEAPSAWHLEAMIEEILSDSPLACEWRRNAIFYIVPQTNPDGVLGGYSRSTAAGVNLEVNWDRPDSLTEPEVSVLKTAINRLTEERPFDVVLNLHSQISPSVTYWIHTPESSSAGMYKRKMLLSALTMNYSPYYRPEDQRFSRLAPRYAEGWLWNRFGENTLAITFETPYTYFNNNPDGTWVSPESLVELAHSSLLALSDLLNIGGEWRLLADAENLKLSKKWDSAGTDGKLFFGNAYLTARKKGATARFVFPDAEKGEYEIYKWVTGALAPRFPRTENGWIKIGETTQKKRGRLTWRYKAPEAGDTLDVILLKRKQSGKEM